MRRLIVSTLIVLWTACALHAQRPEVKADTAEPLVEEWIQRFNALDDWHITLDGKEEGREALVDRMMELYADDVIANVPPHDEDQIGPGMFRTRANLRKWFEKIANTQVRLEYIRTRQTAGEFEGVQLVYSTPLPWGGVGVSFPIVGVWSLRENRQRFMAPGMVVLQFNKDGKIQRMRLYLTEIAEVVPG